MKKNLLEILFTVFIVALIVFPIPPSTIIGVALASHPKTAQYMNPHAYRAVMLLMRAIGSVTVSPVVKVSLAIGEAKEVAAQLRIAAGIVRL